jgi:hypothetical protein
VEIRIVVTYGARIRQAQEDSGFPEAAVASLQRPVAKGCCCTEQGLEMTFFGPRLPVRTGGRACLDNTKFDLVSTRLICAILNSVADVVSDGFAALEGAEA